MKILILGFGKTGQSVYKFLKNSDHDIYVYEQNKILDPTINHVSYDFLVANKILFDLCIRSPGIKKTSKVYLLSQILSKKVVSEIEFASWYLKTKHIIGVTGSNGKTTTCQMIDNILKQKYHTFLLGNIGEPLINYVDKINQDDYLILELSSFILENTSSISFEVVVFTSLSENHLDGVENLDIYYSSKKRILFQEPKLVIANSKIENILNIKSDRVDFDLNNFSFNFNQINTNNLINAIKVAKFYNLDNYQIQEGINQIKIDHYRQEIIYQSHDLVFVNDSKSTSIEATNVAINSFQDKKIILILSGKFKGKNISSLDLKKCFKVYSYGKISDLLEGSIIKMKTLQEVLNDIKNNNYHNCYILFSPSGSSFDLYNSYQERGNEFNCLVKKIWK